MLTDSFTSFGVVAGLGLVMLTGWKPCDRLVAIAIAANILWPGGRLAWRSGVGLLDYFDPGTGKEIREKLDTACNELGGHSHDVRYRTTGYPRSSKCTCYSRMQPQWERRIVSRPGSKSACP